MISIVTPCYNSGDSIRETIESVLAQTYTDWEMLIIDDCSKDGSSDIIQQYAAADPRIKYICTDSPSGSPTLPRNIGIEHARGEYIAFLDSDDLWMPTKLEHQLPLLNEDNVAIVYANYEKMDEQGNRSGRYIIAPPSVTYRQLLKGNVMGCLTVMYDVSKVGQVRFKKIGHEDYALWLSVLKRGYIARNSNTVEAIYRVNRKSVSSNKLTVLGWQWNIYVKEEHTGLLRAAWYFINYACRAFAKRMK